MKYLIFIIILAINIPSYAQESRVWDISIQEKLINQNQNEEKELRRIQANNQLITTNQKTQVKSSSKKLYNVLNQLEKRIKTGATILDVILSMPEVYQMIKEIYTLQNKAINLILENPKITPVFLKTQKRTISRIKNLIGRCTSLFQPGLKLAQRKIILDEIIQDLRLIESTSRLLVIQAEYFSKYGIDEVNLNFEKEDQTIIKDIEENWKDLMKH